MKTFPITSDITHLTFFYLDELNPVTACGPDHITSNSLISTNAYKSYNPNPTSYGQMMPRSPRSQAKTAHRLGQGQGSSRPRPRPQNFVLEVEAGPRGPYPWLPGPSQVINSLLTYLLTYPSKGMLVS